jgi:peptide-methionine (R)-S-oxide reductase
MIKRLLHSPREAGVTNKNYKFKHMKIINVVIISLFFWTCQSQEKTDTIPSNPETMNFKVQKTDAEWKTELTPEQFQILREKGTEYPRTGAYYMHFEEGTYVCAACQTPLFASNHKFESHCGWPSFDDAIPGTVLYIKDTTLGMIRTEIVCAACGGHLGHVFDDGPQETTGQRYCVNSVSLEFKEKKPTE